MVCVPDVNLKLRNTAPAGPKQTKTAKGSGMNPWAGGLYPLPLVAGGLNPLVAGGLNPLVATRTVRGERVTKEQTTKGRGT